MTVDQYIAFRLGPGSVPRMVANMFWRAFTAPSLAGFWRYWNPGYGFFLLKYCYGPLREFVPHGIAVVLTFCACGFFAHDALVLIPAALMGGGSLLFPFVTCWFLLIGLGSLAAEGLGVNLESIPPLARVPVHLTVLASTFWLALQTKALLYH